MPKEHGEMRRWGDGENWFEIFKTGIHTDSNGNTADWSEKDLDEIISLYNPTIHEAPIVIGHPEHDSPAYGWIEGLKREGDKLLAKPKQLVEDFKDWVRKGLYKKVSIALYPDLGLRHVGFLGGTPPAVKGLKQAAFGDQKAKWIIETDLKFMDTWQQETVRSIFQRIRDWIIEKYGREEADKVIGSWDINALRPADQNVNPVRNNISNGVKVSYAEGEREKAKKGQEARSKKYNIAIKDGGNVTKPGEWDKVPDDEFLDPVNYRYPCPDADQTRAAAAYWGRPDNQAQYSSEERALINKRLEAKEKHFKIGQYAPKGGTHMDLKKFFSDLSALVHGAQKELVPDTDGSKFTEADIQAAEKRGKDLAFAEAQKQVEIEAKAKKEAQDELRKIETQRRKDDIAAFCEAQCKPDKDGHAKLTPALRKIIEPIMIAVSDQVAPIQFSETVKKSALDGIKDFLTELPKVVTFREVVNDDKKPIPGANAGDKLTFLTKQKMEQKKDLSYSMAFSEVQKENPELAKEYELEIRPASK